MNFEFNPWYTYSRMQDTQNQKTIALAALLGVAVVLYFFWSTFIKTDPDPTNDSETRIINSIEDLPEGVPPPPAPPTFDKSQFQIPGVTDHLATPTDQAIVE